MGRFPERDSGPFFFCAHFREDSPGKERAWRRNGWQSIWSVTIRRSNAATSRELECAFGIKGKELRDAVNALRREGVPIASNGSGYFYAATEQEVRGHHRPPDPPDRRHRRGDPWG